MESLLALLVFPATLYAVKLYLDRKAKKAFKADEMAVDEKKKAEDKREAAIRVLFKKVDALEEMMPTLETIEKNRELQAKIWDHFRGEIEKIRETLGELKGRLHGK